MIVGFQPGGTIRDARVVLKPEETIPNRFNVSESEVYREDEFGTWILIKPRGEVLPPDSPLLSQPEATVIQVSDYLDWKKEPTGEAGFEHRDIIEINDEDEDAAGKN